MQASAVARQRQLRSFIVAWLGITLLMGALTFAGIYYATGFVNNSGGSGGDSDASVLPLVELDGDAGDAARQDATPVPSPTPRGGAAPVAPGGAAETGQISEEFQLGIQVQPNADPEVHRIWMTDVRDKLKLNWIKQ